MHVIAVANRKGGVGKSTVAANLASAFAQQGRRVLVIDTDSQASATAVFLGPVEQSTMAHVLVGHCELADIVCTGSREGVDIAPGSADITGALLSIVGKTGRETILRRALRTVEGRYDIVIIDTAPEQQLGTVNALVAATHVVMPFTPDPKALEGLGTVARAVHEIRDAELSSVELLGCVQINYDRRLGVTGEARKQVSSAYGELLLETVIRTNANFIVCPAWHEDIYRIEGKNRKSTLRGSLDFDALANELETRLKIGRAAEAAA